MRVLMIGGPADGTWVTTEERTILVARRQTLAESMNALATSVEVPHHTYEVETLGLFEWRLRVAFCRDEFPTTAGRNRAAARAVFQRDVAAQMGVL
ncbi:hypothetical protein [Streptomyces paludis]|uniref:Uncharacterized protein n=1 Tax=Streptomyces paludis TaxID=2282738 RepID=A0A345HWQ6_9ACTN|nr:hypothetical protein [Streptomyces paludis]AXG81130.1 hypothetical protein DVK44_29455 [Streptomyces paludis]